MSKTEIQALRIAAAIEYFHYVDNKDPRLIDLFIDEPTMFFPKFGIARGKAEIGLFAQFFAAEILEIKHEIAGFNVMPSGDFVIVEGQVKGVTRSGGAFPDGIFSQGRFCNVFEFEGEFIKRIHIYEDPDFNSDDALRVKWASKVHASLAARRISG